MNRNIDDLIGYSEDSLRAIKNDIDELKRVPEKYAYLFEKLIALQEYTIAAIKKAESRSSKGVRRNTLKNNRR